MFEYHCKIKRIVDGDTVVVDIDLGFNIHKTNELIRIYSIDTPETRTSDRFEKFHGRAATEFVESLMPVGSKQIMICKEYDDEDKFGRILSDFVFPDGTLLTDKIVDNNLGVRYYGQSKEEIFEQHQSTRKKFFESIKDKEEHTLIVSEYFKQLL